MRHALQWARTLSTVASLVAALLAGAGWPARAQPIERAERIVAVDGVERSYVVHIPPNAPRPAPVVLLFHGGGGRPQGIARKTGMDDLADQHGFIAVYPAGTTRGSGRGGTWNVGGDVSPSSANDVAFVQAVLRDLEQTAPIDHARIYATGLSMGGVFSYRLACEMSDTFAAIAPVAATMVEPSCQPHHPVAILHIHGANDDRIPIKGGHGEMTAADRSWPAPQDGVTSWSHFDSCAGQTTKSDDASMSCTTYGACRAGVEYCVVTGGGHQWPDGASERIWAFFVSHPKQAP